MGKICGFVKGAGVARWEKRNTCNGKRSQARPHLEIHRKASHS